MQLPWVLPLPSCPRHLPFLADFQEVAWPVLRALHDLLLLDLAVWRPAQHGGSGGGRDADMLAGFGGFVAGTIPQAMRRVWQGLLPQAAGPAAAADAQLLVYQFVRGHMIRRGYGPAEHWPAGKTPPAPCVFRCLLWLRQCLCCVPTAFVAKTPPLPRVSTACGWDTARASCVFPLPSRLRICLCLASSSHRLRG